LSSVAAAINSFEIETNSKFRYSRKIKVLEKKVSMVMPLLTIDCSVTFDILIVSRF